VGLLIAVAGLALFGCSDDGTGPGHQVMITGRVIDAGGQGVAGAAILMNYRVDGVFPVSPDKPSAGISFTLPEASWARVWIGDYCHDQLVRTLVDGEVPSGLNEYRWNGLDDEGRQMVEGVYYWHLETPDTSYAVDGLWLLLTYDGVQSADSLESFAVTDAVGRFSFPTRCLPFDYEYNYIDIHDQPQTITITRQVRLWAIGASFGAVPASMEVVVDPETGAEVTIQLPR
jgi:hypothetical protein